ncbi:GNAT family N-acetyltransferase [Estrella lausannensis]|uniref:Putative N-acetylneuraminate synthase n=1 Tax=Estrella lausannensis TaxID=483423 RepID=A0A0H5DSF8_9BACT|nr:GNAT family N-acetyltransferase [Estrella lausannensis]CRX39228.1 putative N-acetylneuraminate synthase [Estrella lausannensis]
MEIGFELILPVKEHAMQLLPWINDHETLKNSFHQNRRHPDEFFGEFVGRYFTSPQFPPVFILHEGKRAGYLRFNETEHIKRPGTPCLEVSICIAPEFRSKKVATGALRALDDLLRGRGVSGLLAEAKTGNDASVKAFVNAGFKEEGRHFKTVHDTGETLEVVLLFKELEQEVKQGSVYIIAEAGSNWRMGSKKRDKAMAKALIDVAKDAGANAVKFQTYRPETVYVENAGKSGYLADAGILEDVSTIFSDLAMPYEMIEDLAAYCRQSGIDFMSTPFSEKDFEEVDPWVARHKIASYENGHVHLLELAAKAKKPLILSTGASTVDEIAWAVSTFRQAGGSDITLLQCTARYPAEPVSMNLSAMAFLRARFRCPVGLSDHSRDPIIAPVMATALGGVVIEKHFTLSNHLPGPDHSFAVLPSELKEMVRSVREAEMMRGGGFKGIHQNEEELRRFARRGLQATRHIEAGEIFAEGVNFAILRPGNQTIGVHPRFIGEIEGKTAKREIEAGSGILFGDW